YKDVVGQAAILAPGLALGGGTLKKTGENIFRLERPRTLTGQLHDAKGAAVAGATIKVRYIYNYGSSGDSDDFSSLMLPPALEKEFSTKTAADGKWMIAGVPSTGTAVVELDDPRYLSAESHMASGEAPAQSLVARPAGSIRGRVLDAAGRPAADVGVMAVAQKGQKNINSGQDATTGKDGRYHVTRLAPGVYNVLLAAKLFGADRKRDLTAQPVALAIESVRVEAGKSITVRDMTLLPPAIVTGTVVDARSGKPVPQALIGAYGPHRPRSSSWPLPDAFSDKEGRFKIAVAPGQNVIYAYDMSRMWGPRPTKDVSAGGIAVTLAKGQTRTVSLRLDSGLVLTGVVVDEAGQPVPEARLIIGASPGSGRYYYTDKAGKLEVKGLEPGEVHISAGSEFSDSPWQVIGPSRLTLPLKEAGPVKITLRRVEFYPLTGRVVTTIGAPVTGAVVRFKISARRDEKRTSWTYQKSTTDDQGRFSIKGVRPENGVEITVEKAGFKYRAGGDVTLQDKAFAASDIVMTALNKKVAGVVVDESGAPVVGARVRSLESASSAEVTTDGNGRFVLTELPEGEVALLAVHGRRASRVRGQSVEANDQSPQPLTITLKTPPPLPEHDVERARTLFREMAQQARKEELHLAARRLAPFDPDAALELALKEEGTTPDAARDTVIDALARRNPERAASWAVPQLEAIQDDKYSISAAARLGLAVSTRDPALARSLLQKAQARLDLKNLKKTPAETANLVAFVAALAARVGSPEAENLFNTAVAIAEHEGNLSNLAYVVAQGTVALLENLLVELPESKQLSALSTAIPEVARYDAPGARKLLDRMAQLIAKLPDEPRDKNGRARGRDAWSASFAWATKYVIRALGPTDPAAAAALARRVDDDWNTPATLALAAHFGSKEERLALLNEAMAADERGPFMQSITIARLAAIAFEIDPKVAARMFAEARAKMEAQSAHDGERHGLADVAFYLAIADPAEARMLIETEWVRLTEKMQQREKSQQADPASTDWTLGQLAIAMAALDIDRAVEMARAIPVDTAKSRSNPAANALQQIAIYALSSNAERRTMSVSGESGFDMEP
ncbi:MAG: carboxypeptidase-like regulatory domain-containing protein, partial [Armatimonadota bacterium]|nr:carboxypeptidase-like regulatory domain-containing protein [Armatimonadota bacterium]